MKPFKKALILCVLPLFLAGATSSTASQTNAPSKNHFSRWLDRPHEVVSESVLAVSDRFDRFFDVTGEEEVGDTRVSVTTGTELREGGRIQFTTGAGARIDLPHLQRRWNILLENIEISEETLTEQDAGDDFSAGLRFLIRQTRRTRIHADGGLRFSAGPIAFGRLRLRRQHKWNSHLVRFTQYVYWYSDDGFGETTRLEHERVLGTDFLIHSRIEADWGEETEGIEWQGGPTLARVLRGRHGWAVFGAVSGTTDAPNRIDQYHTGIRYRCRLYRDWLFLDVVPSLEFNDADDFKPEPVLNIRLEAIFGRY